MIHVHLIGRDDRPRVVRRLEKAFGDVTVARKGVLIDASVLPGFVAVDGGRPVGLLTYEAAHDECEVVAIISVEEGRGIGRALMDAVHDHAVAAGYRRLWLVTTNDNIRALRFYQLGGWNCAASTGTVRGAPGRSSLRSRKEGSTVSCWTTSSSSRYSWAAQFNLPYPLEKARGQDRDKRAFRSLVAEPGIPVPVSPPRSLWSMTPELRAVAIAFSIGL